MADRRNLRMHDEQTGKYRWPWLVQLGYYMLQGVQTIGIVHVVSLFVSSKQVFVLISGYRMSGSQNKEGRRQVGHQEERGGSLDMS